MSACPSIWAQATLGELATKLVDGSHNPPPKAEVGVPMLSARNINDGAIEFSEFRFIAEDDFAREHGRTKVQPNDVLLTIVGAIGRAAVVPSGSPPFALQRSVAVIGPGRAVNPAYLRFYLSAPEQQQWMDDRAKGTAQRGIYLNTLSQMPVRVPPLAEQRRIVAKLDALTARTASARAELERIPSLAARYKLAVLTAALSGELTSSWRSVGGSPRPLAWEEATVGSVAQIVSGVGFPKDRQGKTSGDYPFAKVSDISRAVMQAEGDLRTAANFVDEADLKSLHAKPVPPGSVIFAKIGEALRLNRRAISTVPLVLDNNCMALIPQRDVVQPNFLFRFMQTVDLSPVAVATAVPSVRRGDVASLVLPLPSLDEQSEIVRQIDLAFTEIDRLATEAAAARRLLDRLDQAILARAFCGELVPQDPDDEPASALLERIRAERAAAPTPGRRKRARA